MEGNHTSGPGTDLSRWDDITNLPVAGAKTVASAELCDRFYGHADKLSCLLAYYLQRDEGWRLLGYDYRRDYLRERGVPESTFKDRSKVGEVIEMFVGATGREEFRAAVTLDVASAVRRYMWAPVRDQRPTSAVAKQRKQAVLQTVTSELERGATPSGVIAALVSSHGWKLHTEGEEDQDNGGAPLTGSPRRDDGRPSNKQAGTQTGKQDEDDVEEAAQLRLVIDAQATEADPPTAVEAAMEGWADQAEIVVVLPPPSSVDEDDEVPRDEDLDNEDDDNEDEGVAPTWAPPPIVIRTAADAKTALNQIINMDPVETGRAFNDLKKARSLLMDWASRLCAHEKKVAKQFGTFCETCGELVR